MTREQQPWRKSSIVIRQSACDDLRRFWSATSGINCHRTRFHAARRANKLSDRIAQLRGVLRLKSRSASNTFTQRLNREVRYLTSQGMRARPSRAFFFQFPCRPPREDESSVGARARQSQ